MSKFCHPCGVYFRWSTLVVTGGFKVLASFQTIPNGRVPRAGRHAEIKPIMPVNLCTLWCIIIALESRATLFDH